VLVALAAVDAHMTEPNTYELSVPAPPGQDDALAMVDEGAGAVTKYRVTWKTKADECTGNKCSAIKATNEKYASNGSFKLTVTGKGGSAEAEIFSHPGEAKQSNGLYKRGQGMVQTGELDPKKDLGELTSVKITTTTKMDQSWTPAFVKINTNNKYTGLGSGVYYVPVGRAIYDKDDFEAKTTPGDGESKMTKCEAQFCEEEMDKKLKLSH
jgi:hypothetical protein